MEIIYPHNAQGNPKAVEGLAGQVSVLYLFFISLLKETDFNLISLVCASYLNAGVEKCLSAWLQKRRFRKREEK